MRYLAFLLPCLSLLASPAWCLRPGIPRVTWSSDHFALTIDEKKQDLLPALASLAEECYAKEKAYFEFEIRGRIQMIFLDEQDYANGAAYSAQGWVVIYMHQGDIQLRGRTRWLPGVISHEVGHIFTLRKMGDDSYFLGADFFHAWQGADGSRSQTGLDWTYGSTPPWLAEGLAQYAASICGYDTLDSHRQMVLRVAAASGGLMTLAELKGFAWDGRRNEMLYTQGFSLVSYLFKAYGPKAGNRYLRLAAGKGWRGAFRPAFGKPIEDLYADWRKTLEAKSHPEDAAGDGDYLLPAGPGVYGVEAFPAPLKGGRFLYLSSRDNDYGQTDLFLADGKGGSKRLFRGATSLRAATDGNSAVFTATQYAFLQGNDVSELYRFDAESGSVDRLTGGGRVVRGCESQGMIYGVRDNEGRTSIIRIANGEFTTLFSPPDSMELTDVAPGSGPGSLTVVATSGFGGDIYELDLASRSLSPLANSPQDERDPSWSGATLYFSADYSGGFDVYALADEQVTRITQVAGGAFQPVPVDDGVWFSSYGWQGYRLARAKPVGAAAAPFMVELPVPAWRPPPLAEYEPDTYDHTNLGFLGFNLSLGVIRSPGFARPPDTAGTGQSAYAYSPGSRAVTGGGLHWRNPSGVVEADMDLAVSTPLDYQGPVHPDRSGFELRVKALLPTVVAGASWATRDMPNFTVPDSAGRPNKFIYYQAQALGYLGLDLRLAEHWYASARGEVENDYAFLGAGGDKNYDSDPAFGGALQLDYSNLDAGKDGIVRGFSAFADGGIPPQVDASVPDFSGDAGLSLYGSLRRILYLSGSLFHSEDWSDGAEGWVYGGLTAHCAIPLGMQLGTRSGAGIYLDQAYPALEYRGMARETLKEADPQGYHAGYQAIGRRPGPGLGSLGDPSTQPGVRSPVPGYLPISGFYDLLDRNISHEVGFSLTLKTLSFFANAEYWQAGIRFDASDFSRDPVWSVLLVL